MKYTFLPNTTIKVSKICLGTMTFGNQNSEAEAHEQMDYALEQGVNFIDTAEMYAVPPSKETQGKTEAYIGSWLQERDNRHQVVLATKIAGPNPGMNYIRENMGFSKAALEDALEGSLKRLQTDYIDLYQLHWPERPVNCFGVREYPLGENLWEENFEAVLETLESFKKAGKIRAYGLSNESPWGTMKYLQTADKLGMERPSTIQNAYSLLNRSYEIGLSEISMQENIGLLAYSPLAFGILTGKYLNNPPKDGRVSLFPRYARYSTEQSAKATQLYQDVATNFGISLTQMALAFVNELPFVTSNIIGATKMTQLKENIESIYVPITDELRAAIEAVHSTIPNPAP